MMPAITASDLPAAGKAGDAARHRRDVDAREAGLGDHAGEDVVARELADGFDEVLVGVAVASKDGPHERDYIE